MLKVAVAQPHFKMDNFENIMTRSSDAELIEIITKLRNDYQPDAVTAAENELKKRKLTDHQLAEAQAQLGIKIQEQEIKGEKRKKIQIKTAAIVDTLNPLKEKSTDKTIKLITVLLSALYLIHFFNNWGLTVMILQDIGNADLLSFIEYFAPIVLFPVGLFGFWTLKKYGWIILTVLLTFLSVMTIFIMVLEIQWITEPPVQYNNTGPVYFIPVDNPGIEELLGKKEFIIHTAQFLLLVGLIIYLNRKAIIEKFKISKHAQLLTIGLTAITFIIIGLKMLM